MFESRVAAMRAMVLLATLVVSGCGWDPERAWVSNAKKSEVPGVWILRGQKGPTKIRIVQIRQEGTYRQITYDLATRRLVFLGPWHPWSFSHIGDRSRVHFERWHEAPETTTERSGLSTYISHQVRGLRIGAGSFSWESYEKTSFAAEGLKAPASQPSGSGPADNVQN